MAAVAADWEDVAATAASAAGVRNGPEGSMAAGVENWGCSVWYLHKWLTCGEPLWISFYASDQAKISPHFADEDVEAFPRKISYLHKQSVSGGLPDSV